MTIHESLEKILEHRDDLARRFYLAFFQRCPEAQPYFKDVNWDYQAALLTMALMVVERHFSQGYQSTTLYLKYLGHKHHVRNIPLELYPRWTETMMAILADFHGSDWNDEIAKQWQGALQLATETMFVGYREAVHV